MTRTTRPARNPDPRNPDPRNPDPRNLWRFHALTASIHHRLAAGGAGWAQ